MELLTLVPSRGRPDNIARLLDGYVETGALSNLRVLVDDDDPTLDAYERVVPDDLLIVGPRQRIGPLLNQWAPAFVPDYDVIGFMGDDHLPRTAEWDQRIWDSSSSFSVVYGNDLLQGQRLPTAVWLGAGLVQGLGYFCPPGCQHLYLDNAWMLMGEYLGTLTYLPDVIIEHLHPFAGKAPQDAGYAEVNAPEMYAGDERAFNEWLNGHGGHDLARVRAEAGAL